MATSNLKTLKKLFVQGELLSLSPVLREAFANAPEESVRPLERDPSGEDFLGSILIRAWEWTRDAKGESRMVTSGPLQHAWFLKKRNIDGLEEPSTVVEAFYQLVGALKPGFVNDPRSAHYCTQALFVATMKKAFRKRAQQVRSRIKILKWFQEAKVEEQSADEAPGETTVQCMQFTVHLSPICSVRNGSLCAHEVPPAHGNGSHTSTANAAHFGILQVAQTASHLSMWFVATAASVEYAICLEAHIFISKAQLALVHCIAT